MLAARPGRPHDDDRNLPRRRAERFDEFDVGALEATEACKGIQDGSSDKPESRARKPVRGAGRLASRDGKPHFGTHFVSIGL